MKCTQFECNNSVYSLLEGLRCINYQDPHLFCQECMVHLHGGAGLLFHHIQVWTGTHYDWVSLKSLGLCIQLGHPDCSISPNLENMFNNDFTIIDSDSIHPVSLNYCSCQLATSKTTQLLHAWLFPSIVMDPKTAATFWVLETFQMLSFTSKVSPFKYYCSLSWWTNNTGTCPPPMSNISWYYPVVLMSTLNRTVIMCFSNDPWVATCPTSQMDGPWSLQVWCAWYARGRAHCSVPSLPYSKYQSSTKLEKYATFRLVHDFPLSCYNFVFLT